ncbi:MAG: DNA replication and repair protein RecF [Saprospiraceae bacterium]|nr:DNA replication and repair protein RecF [Saprospiraceae bacterium]MBK8511390.1 DNA replication and repair protein RecF [Saprospiraceae bacterium]MBP7801777.1 DNA replication and repair protein RecF [Saprospiraceae bacterium]MBP7922819.1 DNA replication and repair protein RecF [Saprospiraceae bacterium]
MVLSSIILTQFKNYPFQEIAFAEGFNLIYGYNGSGKTNILDAIHYLALTKSHFVPQDRMAIMQGSDFFRLEGHFVNASNNTKVVIKYRPAEKRLEVNDDPLTRLADHIGTIGMVMIAPDDLDVIDGLSNLRRKYMDVSLSQLDRSYLMHLSTYKKLLDQRNAYLKQTQVPDKVFLQVLNEKMAPSSAYLHQCRSTFVAALEPNFQSYYGAISGEKEMVSLKYESELSTKPLLELFEESHHQDLRNRYTHKGSHKDDLKFLINGQDLKYIGSQGQKKTYLVSLFLAQADYLSHLMPTPPIILLDDIFDKLDTLRVSHLMRTLSELPCKQIIMTDTTDHRVGAIINELSMPLKYFKIENGQCLSMK